MSHQLSEVFVAIAEYALARNEGGIKNLPGCYEVDVDKHWWLAVNGHDVPTRTSEGTEVPKFSAYVKFNGWPAGILDPFGGVLAAGELANEDALLAALRAGVSQGDPSMSQRTFYVTLELRVIAETKDEAQTVVARAVAARDGVYSYIVGDMEPGGDV